MYTEKKTEGRQNKTIDKVDNRLSLVENVFDMLIFGCDQVDSFGNGP